MDTASDPSITFDKNQISNHYWDFQNISKKIWENSFKDEGKKCLQSTINKIKASSKGKDFDCIMGLSGGLDSSYMLHKMVTEYDLKPLVFHVDGGWNSEIAVNNINVLIDKLNLDLYTEVINWEEMKDFQLAMFKSGVPHIDVPQDMAFIGILYKFAERHNIKYILNGGNVSTESVLPPLQILYWGTDMVQIKDILSKFGEIKMETYPFSNIFYHKLYLRFFKRIKVFRPLNYLPYKRNDAIKELQKNYGWKEYKQKHFESRFTKFFEGYWLPTRFNYDMRRNQFSSLILTGQLSREEALKELKKLPYNPDEISSEFEYIANKLDLSSIELENFLELPKKFYWDYKNQKKIFDIGEKIFTIFANRRRGSAS